MNKRIINDDFIRTAVRYTVALVMVIIAGTIFILVQGEDPLNAFRLIINGAFGNRAGWGSTLRYMMPCILLGTAAAVAFKTGVYNMGIEGQLYIGALVAAWIGYSVELPALLHILLCIMGGGIAGMLWALIPTLLKLFFNLSEMVITMMMNYLALLGTEFIVRWLILEGVGGSVVIETPNINNSASLPALIKGTSSNTGLFIALAVGLGVFILFKYTFMGYELKQVGENLKFAKIGGVNVVKMFMSIFMISSFIAGLTGAIEIIGPYKRFGASFAKNLPWEGIMISFISRHSPLAIIVVSFVWGALRAGAMNMERFTTLNKMTIYVLQMLFVLFVSVDYELLWRKIKTVLRGLERQLGETR